MTPQTPHDQHVLGGARAMDELLDDEPVPESRWTWHQVAFLGAVAFGLGIVVWNVMGGTS